MTLIDPTMLFRFSVPCLRVNKAWGATGIPLTPRYKLPSLQELSGRTEYADLRIGWNPEGIYIQAEVKGKERCGVVIRVLKTVTGFTYLLTQEIPIPFTGLTVFAIGLLLCRKVRVLVGLNLWLPT